jgi:P-type Ca2+ transporter type 2C
MSYPAGAGADPGQADEAGAAGDAGGEGLTRPRETGHIQQARIAELPFDAAYKLMVTFHKMTDASGQQVIQCFVRGAPDQLLTRAATVANADAGPAPADGEFRQRYLAENQRLGQQGLRVMAIARKDFDPAAFDPSADLLPLITGLELLALVGIVDPPAPPPRRRSRRRRRPASGSG